MNLRDLADKAKAALKGEHTDKAKNQTADDGDTGLGPGRAGGKGPGEPGGPGQPLP